HTNPSSQLHIHLIYYTKPHHINPLLHTHSPYPKTIPSLPSQLPPLSYLIAFPPPNLPSPPYQTFPTNQLPQA
ncbi:class II aldolase/adducin family protein, partial [Bacillus pseudomycoides]|uniref:class II aldolase/adducin family protein n=1 Tax=Bacillus pseudomycoides TaxID=64104 RepID=UPI0037037641